MENPKSVVPTDKIIGVKVKNPSAEKLGEIHNLVIDKATGHVCYVTVGVGGFLGIGEKDIAVPWNALRYDAEKECFILNADKRTLEDAKALKVGTVDWSNETWGNTVHQQFGTRPYWQESTRTTIYKDKI